MPAHLKVTNEQVLVAWHTWAGERAAAAALRVSRTALRKRLKALGIDTSRRSKESMVTMEATVSKASGWKVQGSNTEATPGTKTALANYPRAMERPTLRDMQTGAAEDDMSPQGLPIRTLKPKPVEPIRIDVANQQRIIEVTRRLALAFGVETSPTLIANQILEEVTERWGQEKAALAKPAEKTTKKAKDGK